jgi:hypothetical protein
MVTLIINSFISDKMVQLTAIMPYRTVAQENLSKVGGRNIELFVENSRNVYP